MIEIALAYTAVGLTAPYVLRGERRALLLIAATMLAGAVHVALRDRWGAAALICCLAAGVLGVWWWFDPARLARTPR